MVANELEGAGIAFYRAEEGPAGVRFAMPLTGKIKIDKAEMIEPKVQRSGDLAVLTFNLTLLLADVEKKRARRDGASTQRN